jgi:imipenem/basic amino acid-specific outer membrane pore
VLLGASAFAIDNVKVDGDAKLYYGTNNTGTAKLFNNGANSFADTALRLGVTGDLAKGVSFGVTGYAISTLGLENNLVGNTWSNGHSGGAANVGTNGWIGEMWVAGTLGKTTAKVGRMSLDTPLAFSETWSVVPNTFEAAVLINQDLPDTTLVGAWVGNSNGADVAHPGSAPVADKDNMLRDNGTFSTFASHGAYAAAVVNNSFKPLTAQAWYYNVVNVADAYWLQGDIDCSLVKGLKIGAQYADMSPKNAGITIVGTSHDSSAYAGKLGYEGIESFSSLLSCK